MKVRNKTIVVTGAGSGIGRALTVALLKKGARVGAIDIDDAALQETVELAGAAGDRVSTHIVNVADREAVYALPEQVVAAHGAVDGVINNAGIIQPFVRVNDLAYDDVQRVMNVNFYGVLYMTKAFLPHLLQRPEAHVVNVSSMGGFFPVPGQSVYGASKAAVKLLTEGLYAELLETKVQVTIVFPGAIDTNISQNSGIEMATAQDGEAASNFSPLPAGDAADAIIDGMEQNKFQVYVGRDANMMNILYRLNPRRATRFMFNQMKSLLPD